MQDRPDPLRQRADLAGGTYARKQIFSRSWLVAWSHRSRFDRAARLVGPAEGGSLLDYGCGDGTFVAMVHHRFARAVGTDVDGAQLADCARRFAHLPGAAFVPQEALAGAEHAGRYDVVTCMEVLEHCVDEVRQRVIGELRRLVAPDGRVIISVPIECGLSLPAKQLARRFAAWRGLGDYRHSERYRWPELLRMTVSPGRGAVARPTYLSESGGGRYAYHGHKGFDWRALSREVSRQFRLVSTTCSPMPVLGPILNSQVWLVCEPR